MLKKVIACLMVTAALLVCLVTLAPRGVLADGYVDKLVKTYLPSVWLENTAPVPEALEPMTLDLIDRGFSLELLPAYIPEGFQGENFFVSDDNDNGVFCKLVRGRENVFMGYSTMDPDDVRIVAKDKDSPLTQYKAHGMTFYIFQSKGRHCACWVEGEKTLSISTNLPEDEFMKIVDSIGVKKR